MAVVRRVAAVATALKRPGARAVGVPVSVHVSVRVGIGVPVLVHECLPQAGVGVAGERVAVVEPYTRVMVQTLGEILVVVDQCGVAGRVVRRVAGLAARGGVSERATLLPARRIGRRASWLAQRRMKG